MLPLNLLTKFKIISTKPNPGSMTKVLIPPSKNILLVSKSSKLYVLPLKDVSINITASLKLLITLRMPSLLLKTSTSLMKNNMPISPRMTRSPFPTKLIESESGWIMLITLKRTYQPLLIPSSPLKKLTITSMVYLIFTRRLPPSLSLNLRRKKSLLLTLKCKLKVIIILITNKIIMLTTWISNNE